LRVGGCEPFKDAGREAFTTFGGESGSDDQRVNVAGLVFSGGTQGEPFESWCCAV
jgi:hypothetical protein